jgi:hypothetical protein
MSGQNRIGKRTFVIVKPLSKVALVVAREKDQCIVMFQNGTKQSYAVQNLEYIMTISEEANEVVFLKYLPKVLEVLSLQIVALSKFVENAHNAMYKVSRRIRSGETAILLNQGVNQLFLND